MKKPILNKRKNYRNNQNLISREIEFSPINNSKNVESKYINEIANLPKIHSNVDGEGNIKEIFYEIMTKAISKRSSDIHIEPTKDYLLIRVRVDGSLIELEKLNYSVYPYLLSFIKLEALMDITEKRIPQDGAMSITIDKNEMDVRVSTIPTVDGEKMVLRILEKCSFIKSKEALGFSKNAVSKIDSIIKNKAGMLLVTGATGSGKTTTVYSILSELNSTNINIVTIEDPVEYKMKNISQIQINNKIGLDYSTTLKAILRQDPDVIMIGEIRDEKTAKIAIRAATTGHLVISTMHTNDAISSITRLIDMNIPKYLIKESLIGIISQRLVRRRCSKCNVALDELELNTPNGTDYGECSECNKGYIGRTAIYEIIEFNDEIRESIINKNNMKHIKEVARNNGMITFKDSADYLIENNITTKSECII